VHAQFAAIKGIDGERGTEAYTDLFQHPKNKRFAFTILPEDLALAEELLIKAEFLSLKTLDEMKAEGWFPAITRQAIFTEVSFWERSGKKIAWGATAAAIALFIAATFRGCGVL
jgi:hypothetical protein